MTYFLNYITEAFREKLNWIKKVRNAMIEVDKTSKDSKASPSKSPIPTTKNSKTIQSISLPVKGKSNLNSSGKRLKTNSHG
ncbi:MAG: hypothetical protein KDD50_04350 [Bdellovibrionales bacterium]|nr:hypothetical protein [Bdellovibrionales bacterium]